MNLKNTPELLSFLSTYISDADAERDETTTRDFASSAADEKKASIIAQAKKVLAATEFPTEEFGSEANRWFGDEQEGRDWLSKIIAVLEEGAQSSGSLVVKDSNGAVLSEGDSVSVIKDLKVKGGSSDLKRGTLIKKIHLIDDAEAIECRVDGSTLVLKTCFLKKA